MDKLASRLRRDAERIEVTVSDDLDYRIAASLQGVTPNEEAVSKVAARRPALFWWASSLTGVAAAAAVIVIVNLSSPDAPVAATPATISGSVPAIDWKAETAVLTSPLQQELDALQSDIKKAEEKVRADIGL
jgi:hypothetical protein